MLIKFAVTNYRGFARRIELNLSHPSNYSFNTSAIKDGVVKNGIVYGPNGSGKSNLALAMFDIVNHFLTNGRRLTTTTILYMPAIRQHPLSLNMRSISENTILPIPIPRMPKVV